MLMGVHVWFFRCRMWDYRKFVVLNFFIFMLIGIHVWFLGVVYGIIAKKWNKISEFLHIHINGVHVCFFRCRVWDYHKFVVPIFSIFMLMGIHVCFFRCYMSDCRKFVIFFHIHDNYPLKLTWWFAKENTKNQKLYECYWRLVLALFIHPDQSRKYTQKWMLLSSRWTIFSNLRNINDGSYCFILPSLRPIKKIHTQMDIIVVVMMSQRLKKIMSYNEDDAIVHARWEWYENAEKSQMWFLDMKEWSTYFVLEIWTKNILLDEKYIYYIYEISI